MTTKTLDLNNIERKIFWTLMSLLGLVAAFYLYSVISLTLAVVARDTATQTAHDLADTAGNLESEYLAQGNSITLAYAQTMGFHEVNAKFANSAVVASVVAGDTGTRLSMAR